MACIRRWPHLSYPQLYRTDYDVTLGVNKEPTPGKTPLQVLEIPLRTTSKDKTTCQIRPKLRTSRNRIRIQDLRSASVAVSSRTSSPDAEVQQSFLVEDIKVDCTETGMLINSSLYMRRLGKWIRSFCSSQNVQRGVYSLL